MASTRAFYRIRNHSIAIGRKPDIDTADNWKIVAEEINQGAADRELTLEGIDGVLNTSTLDVDSTSANDAAAGSGMEEIRVEYIDANFRRTFIDVVPTGTTAVEDILSGASWWAVTDVYGINVGSGLSAAGDISVFINGGNVVVGGIHAGENRQLAAWNMVAKNEEGFILGWGGEGKHAAATGYAHFRLKVSRTFGEWLYEGTDATGKNVVEFVKDSANYVAADARMVPKDCAIGVRPGDAFWVEGMTTADNNLLHATLHYKIDPEPQAYHTL